MKKPILSLILLLSGAQMYGYEVHLINRSSNPRTFKVKLTGCEDREVAVPAYGVNTIQTGGCCIASIDGRATKGRKDCMGAACECQSWLYTYFQNGTKWLDSYGMANHKMRGVCRKGGYDFLVDFLDYCPAGNSGTCKKMRKEIKMWW